MLTECYQLAFRNCISVL